MRFHLSLAAGAILLAGSASAQSVAMGFLHNWDQPTMGAGTSITHRGGVPANMAGECLNRYDNDDHKFWGLNAAGMTEVDGFSVTLQDEDDTTRELFSFVGYNEDAMLANFPDLSGPVISLGQFQMPPTQNMGPIAWRLTATFSFNGRPPAQVAPNQDIFIGFTLPAFTSTTTPLDGLSIHAVHNDPTTTTHDIPGPTGQQGGIVFADTYVCFVQGGTPMYLPSMAGGLRENLTEILVSGGAPGGVPFTQTNQTSYPPSNAPFGTANFLSGLHPDTFDANMTGRADDLGFVVTVDTTVIPAGSPVFFILAFGPSPLGPRPINTFPGVAQSSQGSLAIDFITGAVLPFGFIMSTNNPSNPTEGQAVRNIPLNQSTRNIIANWVGPLDLWWQAIVLNPTVAGPPFEVRTTGVAVQHLK